MTQQYKLGLLGQGIGKSKAPYLYRFAASLCDVNLSYELFDFEILDADSFEDCVRRCKDQGFAGINVTHPFKEVATGLVTIPNPSVSLIGAINTIRFTDNSGHNTDASGFVKAFKHHFGDSNIGSVLLMGAGGVGKAIAYALAQIDKSVEIHLVDFDLEKGERLAGDLRESGVQARAYPITSLADVCDVDGLINCTPLGMYQYPGTSIPEKYITSQSWAFDAVYTPIETQFLQIAKSKGLDVLSGFELFFYQGVDAFEIFTGHQVDEIELRKMLFEQLNFS